MTNPLLVVSIVILLFGLSSFFVKVAVDKIGVPQAIFWTIVAYIIADVAAFIVLLKIGVPAKVEFYNWAAIAAGLTAYAGFMFYYWFLQRSNVSIAAPLTALNPLIAVILGILVLKEKIKLVNAIGILLAIAAAILLSL